MESTFKTIAGGAVISTAVAGVYGIGHVSVNTMGYKHEALAGDIQENVGEVIGEGALGLGVAIAAFVLIGLCKSVRN